MNAEIQQVANRLVSRLYRDDSLPYQTPQHLHDFQIEEVRRCADFRYANKCGSQCAARPMSEEASQALRKHLRRSSCFALFLHQPGGIDLLGNRLAAMQTFP